MDRLRVLTINIWNRQGPWERRLALLRDGIAALAPDLVGLQEVLRLDPVAAASGGAPVADGEPLDQATAIARGLGYEVAYGAAWHIGGGLDFGNAVLSRHPIVERREWLLPRTPGEEARGLLGVEVEAPCGRVPLFVTHLDWKLHHGAYRAAQVEFIAARVNELASSDKFPSILVGDFNAEPPSDEIRYLRGWHAIGGRTVYFADAFDFLGGGAPGHTFARRNRFAALAHEPDRRLDYVFVRGPDRLLRGEPLAARVVLDQPGDDGVFPSDHFGVYAELAAAPRSAA